MSAFVAVWAARAWAGDDVANMSLEQLMNEPVTSVSKRASRLNDSAAAIAVVSQEDIQRLGITSLPEALRLVPGLDVAQISASQWAVSSRGFNSQYTNNLLVLIDGRSVYSPVSGGVFWDAQGVLLEDVDRIEVIRGPGATLWGANAVNGVINIITKRAQESQGTLATATYGTALSRYAARYGGTLGPDFSFRAFVQYEDGQGLEDATRTQDTGAWDSVRGGFRVDGRLSTADTVTLQGDAYGTHEAESLTWIRLDPPGNITQLTGDSSSGADFLGRWSHDYSAVSTLTVQAFVDHTVQGYGIATVHLDTVDIDVQHQVQVGSANAVLWGAAVRRADAMEQSNSFDIVWSPVRRDIRSWSAFVQDEVTLVPDALRLTAGTKFEHDDITGSAVLPNLRLSFTPGERQTVWAAVSRADSTPPLINLDARRNLEALASPVRGGTPTLISGLGNPDLNPEDLLAYELGYRFTPSPALSFDLSSFVNHYRHLIVYVEEPPELELTPEPAHVLIPVQAQNALSASTHGLEAAARWQVLPAWQLAASYTRLQLDARSSPALEDQSPRHQFQVRSYLDLPFHLELNAALFYVDATSGTAYLDTVSISPYIRMDLGLLWKSGAWSLGIWGQNLTERAHLEIPSGLSPLVSEVPRSATARIVCAF